MKRLPDGTKIDTGGPLRAVLVNGVWYVTGRYKLLKAASQSSAEKYISRKIQELRQSVK